MTYPRKQQVFMPVGINTDDSPWKVADDFWTDGRNMLVSNNVMQRVPGYGEPLGDVPIDPLAITYLQSSRGWPSWVLAGDSATLYEEQIAIRVGSGPYTQDAIGAGFRLASGRPTMTLFNNNVVIAGNTSQSPYYWDGNPSNDFTILPGWTDEFGLGVTDQASIIAGLRFHLVALGFEDADKVAWSAAADIGNVPQSWTPAADNDAGSAALSDGYSGIVAAVRFGEGLFIYKNGTVWAMNFIGGNDIFEFRQVFSGFGARSRYLVTDVNNRHVVVTADDIIIHDGTSVQSIAKGQIRNKIFDYFDLEESYFNAHMHYNVAREELWLFLYDNASIGDNRHSPIAIYSLRNGRWSFADYGADFRVYDCAIGQLNLKDGEDDYYYFGAYGETYTGTSQDASSETVRVFDEGSTVALDSSLEKHDMHLGAPERLKFIRGVRVFYEDTDDLELRVGYRNDLSESITWQSWTALTTQLVNVTLLGRYISVELRTVSSNDIYTVSGFSLDYEVRGYH